MAQELNIDQLVDYRSEYGSYIKNNKITGDNLIGICPFHDDKEASFSADLKTGKWHCFAEDTGGNFINFIAKLNGVDTKEAYRQILEKYGVSQEAKPKESTKTTDTGGKSFTLEEYAFSKRLPVEFLKDSCKASTGKDKDGAQYLKLPYFNEEGTDAIFRKRYAHKEFRWSWGSSGKLIMYGDWRLPEIRKAGYAIIVEGESDTQTLWYLKFPALGIPGAANFNAKMVPKLQDLKLYVHIEPDSGGHTFLQKITQILREGEFIGEVYTWSCQNLGVKDPSELFMKNGAGAEGEKDVQETINVLLNGAKRLDLDDLSDTIPEIIKGAPVNLRVPAGWIYDEGGIKRIDEKTGLPVTVCRTPIILTKRLKSMETGEEKVEIAFKRDGVWQKSVFLRSTIFTARGITSLSDLGCTVTSENAKQVVRFLGALEADNIDVITKTESTSSLGWQTRNRFLPGFGDDITLDIDSSMRGWASAYSLNGTFEGWKNIVRPHRERDRFRFILASSFTAPLLKILQQRVFLVHNWGDSKGGKTAALKAALSVWGDPERLIVSFNATKVALERMAGFYNDLPIGIDERQVAGNKQDYLESIVYMLSSGTGKIRGSKTGGLQAHNTWRTVALTTGEEPLVTDTSQTGVSTRVLEVYGRPFDDEKAAGEMHQNVTLEHGWAGPEFIRHIINTDEGSIRDNFAKIQEELYKYAGDINMSHLASISAVTLADALVEDWIFGDVEQETPSPGKKIKLTISDAARDRAIKMAKTIIADQEAMNLGAEDVNENATQFIVDWIISNRQFFGENTSGVCYGRFAEGETRAYIIPTVLKQTLTKAEYNPRKTMKYLADNNIIATSTNKKGVTEFCVRQRFDGKVVRFVDFDIGRFTRMPNEPSQVNNEPEIDGNGFQTVQSRNEVPFEQQNLDLPF